MDQTAMLIAAIAALWGVIIAFAREFRAMWRESKAEDKAEIAELKTIVAGLNAEAKKMVDAKDMELSELRKLLITSYTAATTGAKTNVS